MKIFKRGKHRAARGCKDHVQQIARHHAEIKAIEEIMAKLSDDRDAVHRENERLHMEINILRLSPVTKPLPVIPGAAAMIKSSTVPVALGPSMLVPVLDGRQRDHKPNWAVNDE